MLPSLTQKQSSIERYFQIKILFSSRKTHWEKRKESKLLLRIDCMYMPRNRWWAENKLNGISGGFLSHKVSTGLSILFLLISIFFILFLIYIFSSLLFWKLYWSKITFTKNLYIHSVQFGGFDNIHICMDKTHHDD